MKSRAARTELSAINPADEGRGDYSGPLLSDLEFTDFSKSALVRMADEVCLQMHLLNLGFVRAVHARTDAVQAREISVKQLTGIAGIAAERIARVLGLPADPAGAMRMLELHPVLNPAAYVTAAVTGGELQVDGRQSPAHDDGAWISLCGPAEPRPLSAAVRAVDPYLEIEYIDIRNGSPPLPRDNWIAQVVTRPGPAPECDEVAITRISNGASFIFQPRTSIPITPV